MNNIVTTKQLCKTYQDGKLNVDVLHNIDLTINPGERVAIVGASGSGKSTLLHLLGGLDKPTSGDVHLAGKNLANMPEPALSAYRNKHLGFVYQFHHLLPEFTVLENVCMPLLIRKTSTAKAKEAAREMLERVGLTHRLAHKVTEISGGERQRTAIARALVHQPSCVLADEPTGNLDHHTADTVFETMLTLNQEVGTSLLIVTHDPRFAQKMDRVLTLEDGVLN